MSRFDLVLPVYNNPLVVDRCLAALARLRGNARVWVVDDASGEETSALVQRWSESDSRFHLTRLAENRGYLDAVNYGMSQGTAPYVVLVNSDTEPRPSALERLGAAFGSDDRVGIINAVSTWANWTWVPFALGADLHRLGDFIESQVGDEPDLFDLYNASGFFMALRRSMVEELGGFDEAFRPGYFEETDLCMRALDAGYRVVGDRGLFVYHVGHASFGTSARNVHMERNRRVFEERWGDRIENLRKTYDMDRPLAGLTRAIEDFDFGGQAPRTTAVAQLTFVASADALDRSSLSIVDALLRRNLDARLLVLGERYVPNRAEFLPHGFRPTAVERTGRAVRSSGVLVALDSGAARRVAAGSAPAKVFLPGNGDEKWTVSDVGLQRELDAIFQLERVLTPNPKLAAAFRGYGLEVELRQSEADLVECLFTWASSVRAPI